MARYRFHQVQLVWNTRRQKQEYYLIISWEPVTMVRIAKKYAYALIKAGAVSGS